MNSRDRIRIAFVTGAMRMGGSEAQLLNLINNLPEQIEPVLLTMKKGHVWDKSVNSGVEHITIGSSSIIPGVSMVRSYAYLKKALLRIQPDIVQSHLAGTNILSSFACKRLGIPHLLMEEGMGVTRPFWEKALRKTAFSFPRLFVCNSEAIRERMVYREKVSADRITVIENALTTSEMVELRGARKRLRIENDVFVVVTVASLKPVKGIDFLINGFLKFCSRYSGSAQLLVAGDGPFRKEYELIAQEQGSGGSIRFLGPRSDVPVLLGAADAYVSSSLSEGLSNSVIEAMFSETPVIATDVGGTSVLMRGMDIGTLIPPGDPDSIAKALLELAESGPDGKQLSRAKNYVVERFSTDRVVRQFLDLYEEILCDI